MKGSEAGGFSGLSSGVDPGSTALGKYGHIHSIGVEKTNSRRMDPVSG